MSAWHELAARNDRLRAAREFKNMRTAQASDDKAVQDYWRELTEDGD